MFLSVVIYSNKEKKSVANGLSPGIEEQSEYFDATENPLFKDKKQEQDDEDSGVDNASQILRERSVSLIYLNIRFVFFFTDLSYVKITSLCILLSYLNALSLFIVEFFFILWSIAVPSLIFSLFVWNTLLRFQQKRPSFIFRPVPASRSARYPGSRWRWADSVWPNVCRGRGTWRRGCAGAGNARNM